MEHKHDLRVAAIHALRCNVKSLAAEAKLNRHEERRAGPLYKWAIAYHRRTILRDEARHACLALAFVRGREYRQVEIKCENPPDLKRIYRKVVKWLGTEKDIERWLKGQKETVLERLKKSIVG